MGAGESVGEAYAKAQAACGTVLPTKGTVFISVNDPDKPTILPVAKRLREMGFSIAATTGTARYLFENGILPEVVLKVHEGSPNVVDHMRAGRIQMLINTPLGRHSLHGDKEMRIEAVRRKIPYTTTTSAAEAAVEGIAALGFNLVTMHYLEKGSMYGMLEFGRRVFADQSTRYADEHDPTAPENDALREKTRSGWWSEN